MDELWDAFLTFLTRLIHADPLLIIAPDNSLQFAFTTSARTLPTLIIVGAYLVLGLVVVSAPLNVRSAEEEGKTRFWLLVLVLSPLALVYAAPYVMPRFVTIWVWLGWTIGQVVLAPGTFHLGQWIGLYPLHAGAVLIVAFLAALGIHATAVGNLLGWVVMGIAALLGAFGIARIMYRATTHDNALAPEAALGFTCGFAVFGLFGQALDSGQVREVFIYALGHNLTAGNVGAIRDYWGAIDLLFPVFLGFGLVTGLTQRLSGASSSAIDSANQSGRYCAYYGAFAATVGVLVLVLGLRMLTNLQGTLADPGAAASVTAPQGGTGSQYSARIHNYRRRLAESACQPLALRRDSRPLGE